MTVRQALCALIAIAAWGSALIIGTGAPSAHAYGKQSTAGLADGAITVDAAPITHFEKAAPERTQFGKLAWRGGLILPSPSAHFGGWSGLTAGKDGRRFVAVSDTGVWLTGQLTYDGNELAGVSDARLGALRGLDGQPLAGRDAIDAEGVALLSGTLASGELLISFERDHRIMRYPVTADGVGVPAESLPLPRLPRKLEPNRSLEAVCVLQSGPAKGSTRRFPGARCRFARSMATT
jgi:hypothetical protein